MTRRRFYAPPEAFAPDAKFVSLSAEETRHLRDVLRLKSGDEVYVFDGAGREVRGQVQSITRGSTKVSVVSEVFKYAHAVAGFHPRLGRKGVLDRLRDVQPRTFATLQRNLDDTEDESRGPSTRSAW